MDINFKILLLIFIPVSLFASWCSSYNRKWFFFIKPVPIILLIIYMSIFILSGKTEASNVFLIISLCLCLAGDIFLLFEKYFMPGVAAFLFGHITYTAAFFKNCIELPFYIPLFIILAGISMGIFISIKMDNMTRKQVLLPVCIYILVISTMLVFAMNRDLVMKGTFSLLSAGALSFYASDAVLSFNRFVKPFKLAGILIHITYYGGQLLIICGMLY